MAGRALQHDERRHGDGAGHGHLDLRQPGRLPYIYDYWTVYIPSGEYYQYYEALVAAADGNVYFVTGEYPVDDVEEAEPTVRAVMEGLTIFAGEREGGAD